jgi:hypothetical protein
MDNSKCQNLGKSLSKQPGMDWGQCRGASKAAGLVQVPALTPRIFQKTEKALAPSGIGS